MTAQRPESPGELAEIAVTLAEGAAEIVRHGRGYELDVATKSTATDLVTQVDARTERWLTAELARRRPDDAVLGEESGRRSGRSGVRWVLDPIDGTVNFVLGLPHFAVSVAAEVEGRVVAGAVCNPITGETFRAALGGGAYLGDQRLTGPRDVPLARAVVGTGFGYSADVRRRQAALVAGLLPELADIRRLGAASLDICAVAAGRLDGFFEAGLNLWDFAAAAVVAAEAGCLASGLHGAPPSGRMFAVAGPALAGELFGLLERLGAAEVSS